MADAAVAAPEVRSLAADRRKLAQRARPGRAAHVLGPVREIEPAAELSVEPAAVLPGDARLPPAGGPGRFGRGTHRGEGLSVRAADARRADGDPGRSHRRSIEGADCRKSASGRKPSSISGPSTCWKCKSNAGPPKSRTRPVRTSPPRWPRSSGRTNTNGPKANSG